MTIRTTSNPHIYEHFDGEGSSLPIYFCLFTYPDNKVVIQ
nr:MAG TPA: hypothetical protein [Caudoviricetes sp.]DAP16800.1 MAG TPA: hypothetical protein [Caudoviricetes sp.]